MFIVKLENGLIMGNMVDYRSVFGAMHSVTDEFLAANGYVQVNLFRDHDRMTQKLVPCAPYLDGDKVYAMTVLALTDEEIQSAKDSAMANIRGQRNQLLSASDGTQIPDNPNPKKAEWAAYRQALRDLPSKIIAEGTDPRTFSDWPKDPNWVEPQTAS